MSQVGTSGQATQLAALKATRDAARDTYTAAVASLEAAKSAMINADRDYVKYQAFYFGNSGKPGFISNSTTGV